MNQLPYQQVFWGDIWAEMVGMDLPTQAAYQRLRQYYWMYGPLTNDFEELRSIVGATKKQWTAIYSKALKLFTLGDDGLLHHAKVDAELEKASVKRTRNQNGGFARAEAIKNNKLAHAKPVRQARVRQVHTNTTTTTNNNSPTPLTPPEGFDEFWAAYGKVGSKKDAIAAYDSALKRTGVNPSVLLAAARSYRAGLERRNDLKWQKHAQGWLNGDMWEGQVIVPEKPADTRYNPAPHIPLPTVQW